MTDLKNAGSARFGEVHEGKTAVEASNGTRMIQFGVFEADLRAGELRRKGSRVRLQEQPFQILMMLLQRPEKSSLARSCEPTCGQQIPLLTSTTA